MTAGTTAFGQFMMSYQNSGSSTLGLGFKAGKVFWVEARIHGDNTLDKLNAELAVLFNVISNDKHEFYVGASYLLDNAYDISYFTIPVGIQVRPFETFKRLSLGIEAQPYIDEDFEDVRLRANFAVRYTFGD